MSDWYAQWYKGHKDHCTKNHTDSAPSMEATGVLRVWQTSESKLGSRYTTVISDGASKAVVTLCDNEPYGNTPIIKHERAGRVQKRVGKHLHEPKKNCGKMIW